MKFYQKLLKSISDCRFEHVFVNNSIHRLAFFIIIFITFQYITDTTFWSIFYILMFWLSILTRRKKIDLPKREHSYWIPWTICMIKYQILWWRYLLYSRIFNEVLMHLVRWNVQFKILNKIYLNFKSTWWRS